MEKYKREFIEFLLDKGALTLGEFTLKSGRVSPYFINTGVFGDGKSIERLGYFYAAKIMDTFKENFDILFGPAYKGIPLSVSTAISLHRDFGVKKWYCFDRKEAKGHGEAKKREKQKNWIVGHRIEDGNRILILDDVFTTGATKYDSIELLNSLADDLQYIGLVIAVDRKESDGNGKNAIGEFEEKTGIPVESIVDIVEITTHLRKIKRMKEEDEQRIYRYLKKYGVNSVKERI